MASKDDYKIGLSMEDRVFVWRVFRCLVGGDNHLIHDDYKTLGFFEFINIFFWGEWSLIGRFSIDDEIRALSHHSPLLV